MRNPSQNNIQSQHPRVLIVDDESSLRTALFRVLDRKGFQTVTASNLQEGEAFSSSEHSLDLALIDLRLPDGNGLELLKSIKSRHPQCSVIMLTGFGTVDDAVAATKSGAYHFITKPFNMEELVNIIDKALAHRTLQSENKTLKSALHQKYKFKNIIGQSDSIKEVLSLVDRVSDSDSTILITGDSGTGKELIAKSIHYNSSRANKPFVPINCGAIPEDLLESELFGHIKGAFTGAISNRVGRFEMAKGGTIFLDEIGDMSPNLQVKLLRVLQEKCFEPVGGTKTIDTDVRILTATNVNLEEAIIKGKFREDLYYRINVIPIAIPALKQRQTDIPLLIQHFIDTFNSNKNRSLSGVTPAAMDALYNYAWPGNIRELENLVERISILKGEGLIDVNDLPDRYKNRDCTAKKSSDVSIPETGMDFNSAVDSYENALILQALEKTGWNRNQAAILLRLNRTTLVEKIKKKGLQQPLKQPPQFSI